uniref:Breast cancer type 1 susceptibility protein-like protein n=1 Tax=Schistosoma haematobium TaxID=6185 RepID=A0A095C6I3_SCHHA
MEFSCVSEIEHCLGGIKQFLRCPIWSLKSSSKVVTVIDLCKKVISTYESEAKTKRWLCDFAVDVTASCVLPSSRNSEDFQVSGEESRPRPRNRILLGTTARTQRTKQMNKQRSALPFEEVLTQPMHSLCASTEVKELSLPKQDVENHDAFLDIFSLTQQTQPMIDSFDSGSLFAPVEGMGHTDFSDNTLVGHTTQKNESKPISKLLRKASKRIKRSACLPPLPPVTRTTVLTRNSPEAASHSSVPSHNSVSLKRSSESPFANGKNSKQCRRESNCSVLSGQGLVTKTHEVLCHVQPSENVCINTKGFNSLFNHEETKSKLDIEPIVPHKPSSACNPKKRSHSFSGSLSHTSSVLVGKRLLQKYRSRPHRLSTTQHSVSTKSPGWSRWRQMCRELRRRSSSLRITFHRSSSLVGKVGSKASEPHESRKIRTIRDFSRRSSLSSPGISLPKWGRSVNRSRRRTSEKTVETPLPHGKQEDISDISLNIVQEHNTTSNKSQNGFSPVSRLTKTDCPKETCHFIMPLRRLISRDYFHSKSLRSRLRSSLRQNEAAASPIIQVKSPHGYSAYKCDLDSPEPRGQLNGSNISNTSYSAVDSCEIYCQPLHCSACGETLVLHTDINSANMISPGPQFPELLLRPPVSILSSSMSSSYWQAEDPGDTIFTDAHLDALVEVNRRYISESDGDCNLKHSSVSLPRNSYRSYLQTDSRDNALSHCEIQSGIKVPNLVEPSLKPYNSPTLPSNSSYSNAQPNRTDESEAIHGENIANSESPTEQHNDFSRFPDHSTFSTFQGSSSEIMPTVDRERLRHECEELEAVVAALQKQLEAQADELSPESTAEILKSACTEPLDDAPVGVTSFTECVPQQTHNEIRMFPGSDVKHAIVLETCASETVDIIPSSQTEEEPENYHIDVMDPPIISQPTVASSKPGQSNQNEWRNVTSPLNNSICDFIPGSLSASTQNIRDPISSTQNPMSNITQCPETNWSSCNTLVDENWPPKFSDKCQRNIAVTGSNLSPSDTALLRKFCLQFSVSEHSRFIPQKTTHVVIKEEAGRPRVVKRTLKYFMGILNRAWIVNTDWVRECVTSKRLLDESPYEIEGDTVCGDCHEGPRRGRLGVPAIPQSLDRLPFGNPSSRLNEAESSDRRPFSELWLCAYRNLGALQVADFCQLALDGGATRVFEKPSELMDATNKLTESLEITGTDVRKPRAVILTDKDSSEFNLQECQELYRVYGVPVISIEWMLNCISLYRRLPINQAYRICPTPQPVSVSISKS